MGKRKIFVSTDILIPNVEHSVGPEGLVVVLREAIPPASTKVSFGRNATHMRFFDFADWYGFGIDSITYACQIQIERFLLGQDNEVEASTVSSYCKTGLRTFLNYLVIRAAAIGREIMLGDINRDMIDGYLAYNSDQGVTTNSQKCRYNFTKAVLQALGIRGLIRIITCGDTATFPRNPFPNSNRKRKGEEPLTKSQRQAFAAAVKHAVMPIWEENVQLTGELVAYALLIVALHTGRNTTPLLEMGRDCLRAHPKDNSTFLILWKRRGHNTSKVILRAESTNERLLESTPTVKTNVELLIRRVIALSSELRIEAPSDLQARVWLYRSRAYNQNGQVIALSENKLVSAVRKLVTNYKLTDSNGKPLRLNVSRLRKTFANRIFELLDGDLATTAIALGNSPQVAGRNYLLATQESKRNWRFMGELLVQEMLNNTIGSTYKSTPTGHCSDPVNGQFAPKKEGATCLNFLNCIRCRHYVITAEDLYKLFSFYYRVFAERARIDKRIWNRQYAHIPRLIDNYIVAEGLKRGVFKLNDVDAARDRARTEPHPFWVSDVVSNLEAFA